MQGDDYILYCHPHKQKTPRSDRLREWYLAMLRQAKGLGIVSYISNLHDTFFEGGRDHRVAKPSVTHMPYLEGAPPAPPPVRARPRASCRRSRWHLAMWMRTFARV